jgi:hypothetical protein
MAQGPTEGSGARWDRLARPFRRLHTGQRANSECEGFECDLKRYSVLGDPRDHSLPSGLPRFLGGLGARNLGGAGAGSSHQTDCQTPENTSAHGERLRRDRTGVQG